MMITSSHPIARKYYNRLLSTIDEEYNIGMPNDQLFSESENLKFSTLPIAVDGFDIKIAASKPDRPDQDNAKVDVIFYVARGSGEKEVVSTIRMTLKELHGFHELIEDKIKKFLKDVK